MREKLLSIGDDSWIEDDGGRRAFKVNGKAVRVRSTLDPGGRQRPGAVQDPGPPGAGARRDGDRGRRRRQRRHREEGDDHAAARAVHRSTWPAGGELDVQGNIVDHEFEIEAGGTKVAEVSKKWFRVRDTYGVEVAPGQNDVLILAVTVCIDQMAAG